MINTLIEALVDALKEETVYLDYIEAKNNLNQYETLLLDYRATKEEYLKMKPYFKYQDFTELKARFQLLASQVSELEAYQDYMKKSNALQIRLDELCQQIFGDILLEAEESTCVSLQENTNEEI